MQAFTESLRDRYVLERELGRGSMAVVCLARDVKHDRPVALKVMNTDAGISLGAERFQREIRLAASLQHPHVLPVHSGETDGRLWFTMPYVRGESLRDRLRRGGTLSIQDAIRITLEAAQALAHAHKQRIVHRDVKPENILLTEDGATLVADFGIARTLDAPQEQELTSSIAIGYARASLAAARGDVAGVREESRTVEGFAGRRRTLAYWALRENTLFALDDEQQKALLSLTPADLDGGKADWGLALAQASWLRGDGAQARAYGEVAAAGYAQLLEEWAQTGEREQIMMLRAYGLALAGRSKESIVEAGQAMALERQVGLRNAYLPFIFARIYVLANRPEPAIDQLEETIRRRDIYSRGWMRIDTTFAPLRTNPRFQRLVQQ